MSKDRDVNWANTDQGLQDNAAVNAWVEHERNVIAGTDVPGIFVSDDHLKTWYPFRHRASKEHPHHFFCVVQKQTIGRLDTPYGLLDGLRFRR